MPTAMISAATDSSMVAGKRRKNSSVTGRFVWIEVPKSPCSSRPIQMKYCSMRGLSKP